MILINCKNILLKGVIYVQKYQVGKISENGYIKKLAKVEYQVEDVQ